MYGNPPKNFWEFYYHLKAASENPNKPLKGLQHAVYGNGDETYYTCPEDCLAPGECADGEVADCDGSGECWGSNGNGQLGDVSTDFKHT